MINKVTLIGNLGKDPEIRTLESGNVVCNITLATSENYKDKSGEWQQETEWHNVVIWGKETARFEKLHKGQRLYIEGKIKTDKYEKEGETRYSTKVQARTFRNLSPTPENNNNSSQPDQEPPF